MAEIKLKDEFKNEFVAFGKGKGSNLPLGQRDDLYKLVILGLKYNKDLLIYFEKPLPSMEELDEMAAQNFESRKGGPAKKDIKTT